MQKNYLMNFGDIAGRSIIYRAACRCQSPDCDMVLELEVDEKYLDTSLFIYKTLRASAHWAGPDGYWEYFDFIRVFINKLKMMWKILLTGEIKVDEDFMFDDANHIDEFLTALEDGRRFLLSKKEEVENETSNKQ